MEIWLKLSLILCVFGFLKEIRPSEPYIYEFLIGPWRNVTDNEVNTEVYPVETYSYLPLLIVVFLITDFLRYKPIIVVLGLSGVIFSVMLLWTTSLFALQVLEVFYGVFAATEVAYYTYIYAKVDKQYYPLVTSHTRASVLAGRFCSGVLSQTLISFKLLDYKELNYITLAAMIMATFWILLLPSVEKSIYFHQDKNDETSKTGRVKRGLSLMKSQILNTFTDPYTLKCSLWYALSTCCYIQIENYMQPLYAVILKDPKATMYNGAVEAILTLIGSCAALLAGVIKINWAAKGDILRILFSIIQGVIMIIASSTGNIFVAYILYIIYGVIYFFVITFTSFEIAKKVNEETFALIFGFNTFIATAFQSLLSLVVVTDLFNFYLDVRQQYFVYGCCSFFIALIGVLITIIENIQKKSKSGLNL